MTGLCFTAIVRDEEKVISRCLRSVKPWISCWAISDTGSTDRTLEIIAEELQGIPGTLRRDKWQDFATNRNIALDEARRVAEKFGAAYILTLDADEELKVPEDADLSQLQHDSYNGVFRRPGADDMWQRKVIMRADMPWRFEGVVHEHPVCEGADTKLLADLEVISHLDGKRELLGNKYRRDAALIKRHLRKNPSDHRSWFYLARTLASAGKLDAAIHAYRKRIRFGDVGNPEEVFHSLYQIAAIKEMRGDHWLDVARAYQDAFNDRPWRAEPLWALAALHREADELPTAELYARRAAALPIPPDRLFVQMSIYEWRAADELAGILAGMGRLEEARSILERLSERPQLPESEQTRVAENIDAIRRLEAA